MTAPAPARQRVAMLLENNPYPQDVRVRREAEALVRAGHQVVVFAPRVAGQPRAESVSGVRVRRFWAPEGRGALGLALEYVVAGVRLHLAAVTSLVRGATVLHLHNPPDLFAAAGLLARALRRHVVFDHHDLFPELVAEKLPARAAVAVARLAERSTFAVSDLVLATNESLAEISHARGRVRDDRVAVVRNGPPAAWLDRAAPVREGALEDPVLAYVGAISSQDGVDALADVLHRLRGEHGLPEARLVVVGDGDGRPALEAALAAAGVAGAADLVGVVPVEDVPGHLARADLCVDPSPPSPLNHRSTMIKVAEYMTSGRPVVAYDLLETRRTLGDAGLLVSAGDPAALAAGCARLARDGDERARLAAAARDRVRELVWERSEQALLAAYARLGAG